MKTRHNEETIASMSICSDCLNRGVNTYGECKCSYGDEERVFDRRAMREYGTYMYLQGIEAAKKVVSNEKGQHHYAQGQVSAILSNLEALTQEKL